MPLCAATHRSTGRSGSVVACYFQSWAVWRESHGKFTAEDIDPTLCTHIIYAFAGLDGATNKIKSLDEYLDITKGEYRRTVALKKLNSRLKVTLAVGGWNEGSEKYSRMAESRCSRRTFINSVVAFLEEHNFDGLDLDWNYPASRGGKPDDKNNFVMLCKELRREFNKHGWLLTAAVTADEGKAETAYDLPALATELDYFHLMAYDYHGKWDSVTGHNAPLFPRGGEASPHHRDYVKYSVDYYLRKGIPAGKLVLGLAMYGRTFGLASRSNHLVGAPASGTALSGPYTKEDGFMGYNEISEKLSSEQSLWHKHYDETQKVPYMYSGDKWVSYDDVDSIKLKVNYAKSLSLAGVMVWAIDMDDFRGHGGNGRYPLLNAINGGSVENFAASPPGHRFPPTSFAPSGPAGRVVSSSTLPQIE